LQPPDLKDLMQLLFGSGVALKFPANVIFPGATIY
jgi:hypothetical protein